jgi:hypothetical protein
MTPVIVVTAASINIQTDFSSYGNPVTPISQISAFSLPLNEGVWHVYNEITPTIDTVEWLEEGECVQPLQRIANGKWFFLLCRFYLMQSDSLFALFSESFNWTLVNIDLAAEGRNYTSFDTFSDEVSIDPGWWLTYSWHVDAEWFGISADQSTVIIDFNEDTFRARIRIWCSMTNILSFFIRSGWAMDRRLEPLFAGFDLSNVHIGSLEMLEWREFYGSDAIEYRVYFKAPGRLLSTSGTEYSFTLPSRENYISTTEREIKISMPVNTQIRSYSPTDTTMYNENTAIFTVSEGHFYPSSFTVTSGPPIKEFSQIFLENITYWVTDPSRWVAFGSLIAIIYAAFNGKRLWDRRKTYYRLYRSMVRVFDHYAKDAPKFQQEIESLSKSITQFFIENKINDDQFDKLLARRDDLIDRAQQMSTE